MKSFEQRKKLIIEILIENENKINVDTLCDILNVSKKTLYNDIVKINFGLTKEKSQVLLQNKNVTFHTTFDKTYWHTFLKMDATIDEKDKLLLILLITDEYITQDKLAEQMYISRSKVTKIIKSIDLEPLVWNNKKNNGIKIQGAVLDKHCKIIEILDEYIDDYNYIDSTKQVYDKFLDFKITKEQFKCLVNIHYMNLNTYLITNEFHVKKLFIYQVLLIKLALYDGLYYQNYLKHLTTNIDPRTNLNTIVTELFTINSITIFENNIFFEQFIKQLSNLIQYIIDVKEVKFKLNINNYTNFSLMLAKELVSKLEIIDIKNNNIKLIAIYIQIYLNKQTNYKMKVSVNVVSQYPDVIIEFIKLKLEVFYNIEIELKRYSISYLLQALDMKNNITITTLTNLNIPKAIYINPIPNDNELITLYDKIKDSIIEPMYYKHHKLLIYKTNKISMIKINDKKIIHQLINSTIISRFNYNKIIIVIIPSVNKQYHKKTVIQINSHDTLKSVLRNINIYQVKYQTFKIFILYK